MSTETSTFGSARSSVFSTRVSRRRLGDVPWLHLFVQSDHHRVYLLRDITVRQERPEEFGFRRFITGDLELFLPVVLNTHQHGPRRRVPILEEQPHLGRSGLDDRTQPNGIVHGDVLGVGMVRIEPESSVGGNGLHIGGDGNTEQYVTRLRLLTIHRHRLLHFLGGDEDPIVVVFDAGDFKRVAVRSSDHQGLRGIISFDPGQGHLSPRQHHDGRHGGERDTEREPLHPDGVRRHRNTLGNPAILDRGRFDFGCQLSRATCRDDRVELGHSAASRRFRADDLHILFATIVKDEGCNRFAARLDLAKIDP